MNCASDERGREVCHPHDPSTVNCTDASRHIPRKRIPMARNHLSKPYGVGTYPPTTCFVECGSGQQYLVSTPWFHAPRSSQRRNGISKRHPATVVTGFIPRGQIPRYGGTSEVSCPIMVVKASGPEGHDSPAIVRPETEYSLSR